MTSRKRFSVSVGLFVAGLLSGYLGGRYLRRPEPSAQSPIPVDTQRQVIGSWRVAFKPPASIELPQDRPVIRFQFGKPDVGFGLNMQVLIVNLTDTPLRVVYKISAYDSRNQRVGEDSDQLVLQEHESVVREANTASERYPLRWRLGSVVLETNVLR